MTAFLDDLGRNVSFFLLEYQRRANRVGLVKGAGQLQCRIKAAQNGQRCNVVRSLDGAVSLDFSSASAMAILEPAISPWQELICRAVYLE